MTAVRWFCSRGSPLTPGAGVIDAGYNKKKRPLANQRARNANFVCR